MYGENIKRIREKKKITQEDLSKKIGVSRQAICMWETGKRELRASAIDSIARALSISVAEILDTSQYSKADIGKIDKNLKKREGKMKSLAGIEKTKTRIKEGLSMATKTQSKTAFELMAPNASRVALSGSFNSWDKSGTPLKKEKSGLWRTQLTLKPGKYEYKFIVDGQWWTDPKNNNKSRNSYGSENSVVEVRG